MAKIPTKKPAMAPADTTQDDMTGDMGAGDGDTEDATDGGADEATEDGGSDFKPVATILGNGNGDFQLVAGDEDEGPEEASEGEGGDMTGSGAGGGNVIAQGPPEDIVHALLPLLEDDMNGGSAQDQFDSGFSGEGGDEASSTA